MGPSVFRQSTDSLLTRTLFLIFMFFIYLLGPVKVCHILCRVVVVLYSAISDHNVSHSKSKLYGNFLFTTYSVYLCGSNKHRNCPYLLRVGFRTNVRKLVSFVSITVPFLSSHTRKKELTKLLLKRLNIILCIPFKPSCVRILLFSWPLLFLLIKVVMVLIYNNGDDKTIGT